MEQLKFFLFNAILNFYIFISPDSAYRITKEKYALKSYFKRSKFKAYRCAREHLRLRRRFPQIVATSTVAGVHERMRHAIRIVFSRLISAACRCRSLRSQVLELLFARQKVATAETARRYMYVTAGSYVCVYTYSIYTLSSSSQSWF